LPLKYFGKSEANKLFWSIITGIPASHHVLVAVQCTTIAFCFPSVGFSIFFLFLLGPRTLAHNLR